jgi:ubiquinone/menaquinone biosynthesis C-methylase UbiE
MSSPETGPDGIPLTDRQRREIEYHRVRAEERAENVLTPVEFDVLSASKRRWWNAYWHLYKLLIGEDWRGKKVLIPGSGFGEDAVRFARMGAEVEAFDISPEAIDLARRRCAQFGYERINFAVMPSEAMSYSDNTFDAVLCRDILHHVDIPRTMAEIRRVLKPGGRIIGMELYTHGAVERLVRKNPLVEKVLYPLMQRYVYGTDRPYITEDEHKIDDVEFACIRDSMTACRLDWFHVVIGRLLPERIDLFAKLDRGLARLIGPAGRLLAGRVVFLGTVKK